MNKPKFLERFFPDKKKDKYPSLSIETGSQNSVLEGYRFLYDQTDDFLSLYTQLYDNVSIIESAIDTYVNLINSGFYIESGNEEEINLLEKEFKRLNFTKALNTNIENMLIYGFGVFETVLADDFKSILRFVDIPSQNVRIMRDKQANILRYYQIGLSMRYGTGIVPQTSSPIKSSLDAMKALEATSGMPTVELNPLTICMFTRKGSTNRPYGRSLLKTMPFLTRIMLEMQDSIGKIYKKYGSPRFHVKYIPATQLDQKTLTDRLSKIKEKFNDPKVGQDFFSAGEVEISMIGSEGQALKFNVEMSEIMQGVFAGLQLPAGALGYNYGSTETHLAKQLEVVQAKAKSYQDQLENYLNKNLMPLVAKVYNLKEIPTFKFEKSFIADELVESQVRSADIQTTLTLLDKGLITPEYAMQYLDLPLITYVKPEIEDNHKKEPSEEDKAKEILTTKLIEKLIGAKNG